MEAEGTEKECVFFLRRIPTIVVALGGCLRRLLRELWASSPGSEPGCTLAVLCPCPWGQGAQMWLGAEARVQSGPADLRAGQVGSAKGHRDMGVEAGTTVSWVGRHTQASSCRDTG